MRAQLQNPQEWLIIGQGININDVTGPKTYDECGKDICPKIGTIVEHLANGSVVVKFDGYFATWDYTAREARKFSRVH